MTETFTTITFYTKHEKKEVKVFGYFTTPMYLAHEIARVTGADLPTEWGKYNRFHWVTKYFNEVQDQFCFEVENPGGTKLNEWV